MGIFEPKPTLSEQERAHGLRMMTLEGMASTGFTSITASGFLAAYALALGASNLQIGILAAIPFIMQPLQIPTILLVERLRRRKLMAVTAWFLAQLMWFPIALIPVFMQVPGAAAISVLLGLMGVRGVFSAVTNCNWNSWVRDLVPQQILGRFFSRRIALSTAVAAAFGMGAAFFVDYWRGQVPEDAAILGYTYVLLFGALFLGLASPLFMSRIPEPEMHKPMGERPSLLRAVTMPLHDRNFRQLMKFLLSWGLAVNMAVPFFAVYMLQRLGMPLSAVIGLSVLGQFFNILFLRVWGPLTDRFGSKTVLSLCASLYLLVILGWAFTTMPERHFLTIPLLIGLHIFAGIATAGVSLTIGTIGYKLAPQAHSAPYLAGASLATNLGAGIGPLLGGLLAQFFHTRTLALDFTWIDPTQTLNLGIVHLTGLDFLFVLTFIIGLSTLNVLAALREEGEADREAVLGELRTQTSSALQLVGFVPTPNAAASLPASLLSRVPGVDIAIGVTAYQLADTARTVTVAALRGRGATVKITRALRKGLAQLWKTGPAPPRHDTEVAREAARGAIHAVDEVPADLAQVAGPALVGIVRALDDASVSPYSAIRGAAYGVIEGAIETGADPGLAATEAIAGARQTARDLKLEEEEAVQEAARGALQAAQTLGPQATAAVDEALRHGSSSDAPSTEPPAPAPR